MINKQFNTDRSGTVGRPRTDRGPITVRLSVEQIKWIDWHACKQQTGRSDIVRQIVQTAIESCSSGPKEDQQV